MTTQPPPTEDPITDEELGVAALPADASPAQRAHAEAVFRTAKANEPCRCSGYVAPKDPEKKRKPCPHGTPCGADGCPGTTLHVDRYPGGIFDVTLWADDYVCSEECSAGSAWQCGVLVPDVPWGYYTPSDRGPNDKTLHVYPGTRHPNFHVDIDEDEDEDDEEPR